MIDQPDAATLLEAMGRTLSQQVIPELTGSPAYTARVVANLCHILSREGRLASDRQRSTADAVLRLLTRLGEPVEELNGADRSDREAAARLLDQWLAGLGTAQLPAEVEAELSTLIRADVEQRLDIARPGYRR